MQQEVLTDNYPTPRSFMHMQASPEAKVLKLTAQEYISIHIYIYEMKIPQVATAFLAVNRESVDHPKPLVHPDNRGITDPKNLKAVLNCNSSYGGTRAEPPLEGDVEKGRLNALNSLLNLAFYESHGKHKYLSQTNANGALDGLISPDGKITTDLKAQNEEQRDIPEGYSFSRDFLKLDFQGGRAIILAENQEIHKIITDSNHPLSYDVYSSIFKPVGKFLNGKISATKIDHQGNVIEENSFIPAGALFITPDFGPNRKLADYLHEHTPQVLGVDASVGGGGGKAAYTVSGFFGAFDAAIEHGLFDADDKGLPITLIGAAGSMGADTARRLADGGFKNVLVADIAYDYTQPVKIDEDTGEKLVPMLESTRFRMDGEAFQRIPPSWDVALAEPGKFTDQALGRNRDEPRVIIAMTFGKALQHSNLDSIPDNSTLFLSENWAIPPGNEGFAILNTLKSRGIIAVQGQAVTPGGAGNSKVEIFFRATANGGITRSMEHEETPVYHKRIGHEIVYRQVKQGTSDLLTLAREKDITTIEALAEYTNLPILSRDSALLTFQ